MFRQDIKNLAYLCAAVGMQQAVISPGSRNTPLTLAFTEQDGIDCFPVTDERSAGFFALGMAQYSTKPVALICTSGTAVLNFAPAVAEAYYQHLPLIVITADRPGAWIDQADGQTIRQQHIFGNYIKASFQLPTDIAENTTWQSDRTFAQALDMAMQFPCGPVHLNVPLEEPLYAALPEKHSSPRIIRSLPMELKPANDTIDLFIRSWEIASKRMILVGIGKHNTQLNTLLETIARETETLVIAENLSNISGKNIISNPDVFFGSLSEAEKKTLQPDLLITIGNSIISKQLKHYLRQNKAGVQWQLQSDMPYADTYQSLNYIVAATAEKLLQELVNKSDFSQIGLWHKDDKQNYRQIINTVYQRSSAKAKKYIANIAFSDMVVFRELLPLISPGWVVHLSNSTPVRISQLFVTKPGLEYYSNRGTSGIEGSVSTAVGSAIVSGKPTLLITGDLSFLYDSNGLWNRSYPENIKILVLNNGGANIFRMIGNNAITSNCQEFFDASHQVNIAQLTSAFGINHQRCDTSNGLVPQLNVFLQAEGSAVLEVITDRDQNVTTYNELFKHIR